MVPPSCPISHDCSIDFTVSNPPFYSSTSDLLSSAAAKSRPPRSACTGADVEMVTPGGEIAFVSRMIDESKILKDRCQWYTSMVGKYSSVEIIVGNLRGAGVDNWAVKDLVQGNKTRRWAVAWSWGSMRPSHVRATSRRSFHSPTNTKDTGYCERYLYASQISTSLSFGSFFYRRDVNRELLTSSKRHDPSSRYAMAVSPKSGHRSWLCQRKCLVPSREAEAATES